MIRMRPGECGMRFALHFPADSVQESQADDGERGLRILSEPSGTFRRSSGSWGEWIVMYTRRRRRTGTIGALPTNHSPHFAPVIHPTLETGVETLVVTALAWLRK